ncbi:Predicted transcriptional regulator [Amycolatopsis arida]|uniref:Predicted transcriptional regulator n=1 Tax=Amycolatopsis arida TaxID=587909 RepID=A0A1I5M780_9PSEU|nr:BlaI/MecI/CopY family transcriptional regulator [Amycolatopsis arida]TDX93994.1 putative transcriptional regulator [Amycolatopsis arida]SFP05380.1 Predicted transcriptional regulator [Amycolatopsis arida]
MRGFGELEAVVMDRVWTCADTITVREVFESLKTTREIAYTTVMSTMDNLHRKGWLARERQGRAFRYWPTLTREEYSARLMRDALDAGGNPDVVLTRFLEQMTDDESSRLRDVLRRWTSGTRASGKRVSGKPVSGKEAE